MTLAEQQARYYQELARGFNTVLHTMVLEQPADYAGRIEDRLLYQDLQRTYSLTARHALWRAIYAANAARRL
jgi:hypothetical protein